MKHYIAIIIGAGQAGVPLANSLAKAGKKTAIIERAFVFDFCCHFLFLMTSYNTPATF
ncbi:FAD-binding protein [Pedobacter sp. KBS0701]|uniref:FAD-binding protein n=1 Tax=Pedobacter sp. KBS0701 TaxID=2578106 RepID=UPI00110D7E0E|nr:FAD-binding protein [Pedobacter sp. KBS0701]QDW24842.1 FAD-binding protein [Pedobacter sp. KBS0701]